MFLVTFSCRAGAQPHSSPSPIRLQVGMCIGKRMSGIGATFGADLSAKSSTPAPSLPVWELLILCCVGAKFGVLGTLHGQAHCFVPSTLTRRPKMACFWEHIVQSFAAATNKRPCWSVFQIKINTANAAFVDRWLATPPRARGRAV